MSPVFRHGALRLYLLKLLDEQPRHGYEVISLLEDRFLGFYSPSAGTVYPRLAKLESEGLVEHEEADGRKVYRLTEAGRQELEDHMAELKTLEADLALSIKDLAKDVRSEVRTSVREVREEIKAAAREIRRESRVHARRHGGVDGLVDSLKSDWRRDDLVDLSKELARFMSDTLQAARRAESEEVEAARAALREAREAVLKALRAED